MKIYKAKVKYTVSGMAKICNPEELLYESPGYVGDSIIYKPEGGGYPLTQKTVENNPDEFEFIREDNEHDSDYYLKPIYTQAQIDNNDYKRSN